MRRVVPEALAFALGGSIAAASIALGGAAPGWERTDSVQRMPCSVGNTIVVTRSQHELRVSSQGRVVFVDRHAEKFEDGSVANDLIYSKGLCKGRR